MRQATSRPDERGSHEVRREAHEWCAQIEAGGLSPTERQCFANWLSADPSHEAAYERATLLWQEVGDLDEAVVPPIAFRPLFRERFQTWCDVGWGRWSLRFTGVATAFATIAFLFIQILPSGWYLLEFEHYETAVAEVRDITLSDDSVIALGAQTSLSVAIGEDRRRVRLHSGEAFFDVEKDKARPFTIRSGESQVTVIGTAFNLRQTDAGLRVAVAEGRVEVGAAVQGVQRSAKELRAGEQVLVSGDGEVGEISPVNPDKLGAWRRNRLIYVGATLAEVLVDANRYRDGWIILRDRELADLRITGAFDARDIDGMLATLAEALPITLSRPLKPIVVIGPRNPAKP